ncbi:MAG: DUF177 domain-containing protein [Emcibacteraceae bacterium]|nr:DUF177 domain-containing protein [Emcibacteraceae bacterium]
MSKSDIENEFSRVFNLELIKKSGTIIPLDAADEECEKLAKRFSIPKVVHLKAKCSLKKLAQKDVGDYRLSVEMDASIVQNCVVTLEDINESIIDEFSIVFQIIEGDGEENKATNEIDFDAQEQDIEIITDKMVDIGEYVAEYLSLSMKPYPRHDKVIGNELGHKIINEEDVTLGAEKRNPFSVLKDLKHKT